MHGGAFAGVKATASENWFTKEFLKSTNRPVAGDDIVYTPEADLNIRALAALYRINGSFLYRQTATSTQASKTWEFDR